MLACGHNKYLQLGENSNAKNDAGFPIISPPKKSRLDTNLLLSYSVCMRCSIWITNEGKAYAIGDNQNLQISGKLPKKILETATEISIKDKQGHECKFISALSDGYFSLYLISPADGNDKYQLAFVCKDKDNGNPLFLNIGSQTPIGIFGNYEKAAVIDSEGAITIITDSVFQSPNAKLHSSFLPKGEKADFVTFCKTSVLVLSSNGHVYECQFPKSGKNTKYSFTMVPELSDKKIVQISSFINHCLAVSGDGKVFGRGLNDHGQLCFEKGRKSIDKFTEIVALNKIKIRSAFAGSNYSLFCTYEGKILASGTNWCGELLLESGPSEDIFTPVETSIKAGASSCITGSWISTAFVDVQPPPRSPNLSITQIMNSAEFEKAESKNMDELKKKIKELEIQSAMDKIEFEELREQNEKYALKIKSYEEQLKRQKIENQENENIKNEAQQQKERDYLQKIKSLEKKIEILEKEKLKEFNELKREKEKYIQEIKSLEKQLKNQSNQNTNDDFQQKEQDYLQQIKSLKEQIQDMNNQKRKESEELQQQQSATGERNIVTNDSSTVEGLEKQIKKLKQREKDCFATIKLLKEKLNDATHENQRSTENQQENKSFKVIDTSEIDKIKILKKLGRGATSEVFKVSKSKTYAMKVFDASIFRSEASKDLNLNNNNNNNEEEEERLNHKIDVSKVTAFLHEYEILNCIQHPNIIKTYGVCFGDKTHEPSILLEYCPYNLHNCLNSLSDKNKNQIVIELCQAMKYIHSKRIIHRDLKPENILITSDLHVKLSDFGISKLIPSDSQFLSLTSTAGTLRFMAPELLNEKNYNEKVDVYSFGVILYLILMNGEYPNITMADLFMGRKAPIPQEISNFSRNLINQCWSFNPNDRPSFEQISELIKNNMSSLF